MCGRYALTIPPDAVRAYFAFSEQPNFPPRYNIAPTQPIAAVRYRENERHFDLLRWGLIPSWAKDLKKLPLMINARAETILEKPAFRNGFRRRRCLIPVDAFYEWQKVEKGNKRPFMIRRPDRTIFAFAGIWEHWMEPGGSEMESSAILTTNANAALSHVHHRMPVVIHRRDFDIWLKNDETNLDPALNLLTSPPDNYFEAIEISNRVNKVKNEDASIQDPVSDSVNTNNNAEPETGLGQLDLL